MNKDEEFDPQEFSKDLRIDLEALDETCLTQSEIFWKWSERARMARSWMERREQALEIVKAEVEGKIRKNPSKYGVEPGPRGGVTEGAISNAISLNKVVRKATLRYLNARNDSQMFTNAVSALDYKKRSLEGLITLHGQQYFAGPKEPRNLKKVMRLADARLERRYKDIVRKRK